MLSCTNSKVIRKKNKKVDILGNLPPELVHYICLYLTPSDIFAVWNSNSRWRYQITNENFWKQKCRLDNHWPIEEFQQTAVFKKLTERFNYWHSTYYYSHTLKNNWINDIYEEIPVQECSSLKSITLYYFDDETAIIGAKPFDKLYVINPSTGTVQNTFPVDPEGGNSKLFEITKVDDKLLFFAFYSISLWNIHTTELLMTKRLEQKTETIQVSIHKNVIGFITTQQYNKPHGNFYILNIDTLDIQLITQDVKKFHFYENLGILLKKSGSLNIFNIDNVELINHSCPEKHHIASTLLQDHYLIVFCEKFHMSTWTIDNIKQSLTKLISFTIFDLYRVPSVYEYVYEFLLLGNNKIAYKMQHDSNMYIWDFLKGIHLFNIEIREDSFKRKVGNQLVVLTFTYTESYLCFCEVWCPNTHKLIRKSKTKLNCVFTNNKVIHFTETKMLVFKNNVLTIQDYEKKIKIDP